MSNNTNSSISNFCLKGLLEKDKLTGLNYVDWLRNLRIVLRMENKQRAIEEPLPAAPVAGASRAIREEYEKRLTESNEAACLMLATMVPELQKGMESLGAYDMANQLKDMFQRQARQERYDNVKALSECKMAPGSSVSVHVLKMKSYIDQLERLGFPISQELATDFILSSLSSSYEPFVLNYQMNNLEKTIMELHGMLKTAESNMAKSKPATPVLAIREGGIKKKKAAPVKGKGKGKAIQPNPKPKTKGQGKAQSDIPQSKTPEDVVCFYCKEVGHWRRSCPKYLEELKKLKANGASTSGTYMIELHSTSTSNSWVLDTGCGTHICTNVQGLKRSRKVRRGELDLIMGNKQIASVDMIGNYELSFSSGLSVVLIDCCYSAEMARNIISFYALYKDDKSYMWHCRLGHISKKRITKLQSDGILESFDHTSNDECESCLLGKMTKAPFTGTCERGKDLLDIVHTDVCGPFRSATRHGERYFVTFTDDFSRYGYVYLIKHKSETIEVFRTFQNEVENQLNRKIKTLRSDRGGEYLSHEFRDHLRSCGIIAQLTPPRTPQHNGVAERRNRTLLDMVSKTPSEIWSGEVPSLAYLKVWGCEAYVRREAQDKLEPRSERCYFVGYPTNSFGYLFYKPSENKVFVARRAWFLERELISKETSGSQIDLEEIQESTSMETDVGTSSQQQVVEPTVVEPQQKVTEESDIQPPPVRRSDRVRHAPERYNLLISDGDDTQVDLDEPTSYQEAMAGPEAAKWKEAMESEMQSMYDNQVCDLVDHIPSLKIVGHKWVFKKKTDMDGKVHTYKARLVAKGYTQAHGEKDSKKGFIPMQHGLALSKAQCPSSSSELERMSRIPYASAIGSIMYAMICTRPDVSCALSMTSRYQANPGNDHWTAVKNILRYLRRTKEMFLVYGGAEELSVKGYTDASFQTDRDDSCSQSGFVFLLNGGAVSWRSSKQSTVADSTTEAEYIAVNEAAKEAVWMKKFIGDLGVVPSIQDPIEIFCDNEGAVILAKEPRSHKRTRHILRKFHYVRKVVEDKDIIISRVGTDGNLADPFTKPLSQTKHDAHTRSIGIRFASDLA
ncbi:hypothetical protein OSB04_016534 [Centaurea solstitialis]|uniref:Polyprotein n=1 Tax=Centaurea solstitialis TaxID=347529 RepID=A0AA38T2S5_9ASTR|nr:hypothetical protein OSB04_016534 [Centaurea solstitialis]